MLEPSQIILGLEHLGIKQEEIAALQHQSTFEVAQKALAELKERAKKAFRKKAVELHPDRNQGDAEKTNLLKVISQVNDEIQKLELRPPVQPVPVVFAHWRQGGPVRSGWPIRPGVVFVKIRH